MSLSTWTPGKDLDSEVAALARSNAPYRILATGTVLRWRAVLIDAQRAVPLLAQEPTLL